MENTNIFYSLFKNCYFESGCLKIGISGHRFLRQKTILKKSLTKILEDILKIPELSSIKFYSPLAEGADQIAAALLPAYERIDLVVPLPLAKEDYLTAFKTQKGRKNFNRLLNTAKHTLQLPEVCPEQNVYVQLAHFLAQEVDLMIVIWNGEDAFGPGGTGDVIRETLALGKPICWIYANNLKRGAKNLLDGSLKIGEIRILNSHKDVPEIFFT